MSATPAVWAPFADRVELVAGGRRSAMTRRVHGWWESRSSLARGTDYAFSLNGGKPLPDPRSPWQPAGVHGPSRTVDHQAFSWTDGHWRGRPLQGAVIYELHVGTFSAGGTFDGAIEHLGYLAGLGVTHLELMPVVEFIGDRGWGYDGVDLFAPHHAYGGPDGLKRLVDAAHGAGLAVLLDVVYNHLGPEGNYLGRFGPYFTARYRTPWGEAVNFDGPGSDEVRRFVLDNALGWLRDYHLDGLRVDAVHAILDTSPTHICEELGSAVHQLAADQGRTLLVIAESDVNDPRLLRPTDRGGDGLDAVWADDLHHALHVALTGEDAGYYRDFVGLDAVGEALREPFLRPGAYRHFRERRHGRRPEGLGGDRFVAFLQNHDHVGNRARGERIGHLVSAGRQMAGAAIVLLSPYVPLLFAGEEWAAGSPFPYFTGHADPGLAEAVRRGRVEELAAHGMPADDVLDPQDPGTFARARLDWSEPMRAPHAAMLAWYRALLQLRREHPALVDGDRLASRIQVDPAAGWLTVERAGLVIAVNLGTRAVRLPMDGDVRLASAAVNRSGAGGLELPPDTTVVVATPAGGRARAVGARSGPPPARPSR
jgi:maltooligosyltrehalose trehalohydrolase